MKETDKETLNIELCDLYNATDMKDTYQEATKFNEGEFNLPKIEDKRNKI